MGMTKHYVDNTGRYMGGFDGEHGIDVSAWTEVDAPPPTGNHILVGGEWQAPALTHDEVVKAEVDALFAEHVGADEVVKIQVRTTRLLGKVVVTGGTLTAGEQTVAGHALNAAEWYADVLKERDRAIADGDAPVWPVWNSAWDAIFAHI